MRFFRILFSSFFFVFLCFKSLLVFCCTCLQKGHRSFCTNLLSKRCSQVHPCHWNVSLNKILLKTSNLNFVYTFFGQISPLVFSALFIWFHVYLKVILKINFCYYYVSLVTNILLCLSSLLRLSWYFLWKISSVGSATGNPTPQITWKLDGFPLPEVCIFVIFMKILKIITFVPSIITLIFILLT